MDTYDLVLSTVKTKYNTNIRVLYIDKIFDKEVLKRKIKELLYSEKLDMPLVQGMDTLLLSILKEERFFILNSQLSYQENIDLMVDSLYLKGYVDEGFKDRIREREKKSTMAINDSVALPHTINYKSKQILISLGVSKDGVKINSHEKIKLIFLICLPEQTNDDSILVRVYDELTGFEGKDVGSLTEKDCKGLMKPLKKSILEASSNYNIIMAGGEVLEPPSPIQRLTNIIIQKK